MSNSKGFNKRNKFIEDDDDIDDEQEVDIDDYYNSDDDSNDDNDDTNDDDYIQYNKINKSPRLKSQLEPQHSSNNNIKQSSRVKIKAKIKAIATAAATAIATSKTKTKIKTKTTTKTKAKPKSIDDDYYYCNNDCQDDDNDDDEKKSSTEYFEDDDVDNANEGPDSSDEEEEEINDDINYDKSIVIISEDDKKFPIDKKWCSISKTLYPKIQAGHCQFKLFYPARVIEKLISYLEFHEGQTTPPSKKPIRCSDMLKICECKWDAYFIDDVCSRGKQELYNLTLAARDLDIEPLIDLCCTKIAALIKGRPHHVIVKILKDE